MKSQLSLESFASSDSEFRAATKEIFLDILGDRPDVKENCLFNKIKKGWSISFFDPKSMSFWIHFGAKRNKLEFKASNRFFIDTLDELYQETPITESRHIVEPFGSAEELYRFKQIICDVYDYRELEAKGRLFDCCYRYEACSDALDCIHPDKDLRMCCSYRRKLKRGIVFYGKNRNID